mgnify:CR=1 FL=1
MEKIFIIGDDESLISELSELLMANYDIADELSEDVEFVFELTNFNREVKFNILNSYHPFQISHTIPYTLKPIP